MNIGAAEIILILLVAFVIVGPKDLPKVARALGRFVKYIRGMVEEVKHELGVENVEADLKTLDREVKDTVKDLDIRQDLQKTQLDMNKEFKKIDQELSFKDFKDQLKKGRHEVMRLGTMEIFLIVVLALVLFGGGKIAGLGKALGQSIREFKKEVKDDEKPEDAGASADQEKKSE